MPIVTIGRELGAGGSRVARIIAESLGAELVDRSLIAEVARRLEFPEPAVERTDEYPESFVERLLGALRSADPRSGFVWQAGVESSVLEPRHAIIGLTEQVIREAARTANAVIVGRGGAFVLRGLAGAVHVFLRAPESARRREVSERFVLSDAAARKRIRASDAGRAGYVRQLYDADWRDAANYDLVLNTGRFGLARTADTILAAIGDQRPTFERTDP